MKGGAELDPDNRVVLQGAHGEEIVRSLLVDTSTDTIFTAGEDGCVKAFRPAAASTPAADTVKSSKATKKTETRYKPY
jgi:WD repeat-containing protein 89